MSAFGHGLRVSPGLSQPGFVEPKIALLGMKI
jgi:hypothetical protein